MFRKNRDELLVIINIIEDIYLSIYTKLHLLKNNVKVLQKEERVSFIEERIDIEEEKVHELGIIKDLFTDDWFKKYSDGYELNILMNKVWNNRLPQEYALNISTKVKDVMFRLNSIIYNLDEKDTDELFNVF